MMEKLQCTCCGGKLVMNANGNAVCQFCGMEYAPEAMKKLIVEMKGTVQVEGVDTADALAKRAETFLSLGERGDARMNFQKLTQLAPDDYRGWWGLTRVFDWDDYFRKNAGEPLEMPSCCQRALRFAPEGKKAEIRACYNEKAQMIGGRVAQNYAKTQQQLSAIGAKRKQYERMSAALLQEERQATLREQRLNKYGDYRRHVTAGTVLANFLFFAAAVALNVFLPHPISLVVLVVAAFFLLEMCYLAVQKNRYKRAGERIRQIRSRQAQLAREKWEFEQEEKRLQEQTL